MYKFLATAVIAVSVATPVLAQSVSEKTGVNSTLGISPSDQDFVTEVANSDMLEIESSKLVAAKSDTKDKAFADHMIKDHTATICAIALEYSDEENSCARLAGDAVVAPDPAPSKSKIKSPFSRNPSFSTCDASSMMPRMPITGAG